jgi:hypothetical protein
MKRLESRPLSLYIKGDMGVNHGCWQYEKSCSSALRI